MVFWPLLLEPSNASQLDHKSFDCLKRKFTPQSNYIEHEEGSDVHDEGDILEPEENEWANREVGPPSF